MRQIPATVRPMARSRSSRRSSSSSLRRTLAIRLMDPADSLQVRRCPRPKNVLEVFFECCKPILHLLHAATQRDPHLQRSPNTQKSSDDKRHS